MGQKVGGYRRNVPYGEETRLLSNEKKGWRFHVNPKGKLGWNRGTSGRKEKEYGKDLSYSRRLRKELEEVRRSSGSESNGLGRKGTKERGYVVYGEYRGPGKPNPKQRKKPGQIVRKSDEDLKLARERVCMKYEKLLKGKVERKRVNLKERRKSKGLEDEKKERESVLGYTAKRLKGEERCETIVLSGVVPTGKRRTNLIVRELENGLNHMEVLRNTEALRRHHAKSSQNGRKRLGLETSGEGSGKPQGGYYGFKVSVKGPLEGARRTMTYGVQLGTVPRGTKRARRRTTDEHAKTKVGTLGVRVTYCYGRG